AVIEFLSKSERAISANYYIYGVGDDLIAAQRGVRCQAIAVKRIGSIETVALLERPHLIDGTITGVTGVTATVRDVLSKARPLFVPDASAAKNKGPMLVEGWATAAAYEIVSGLADDDTIDVDLLISAGRLPEELRSWLTRILVNLEAAGLTGFENGLWTLAGDAALPDSAVLVKAIATEYPSMAADLLLAGAMTGFAQRVMADRAIASLPESILTNAVMDFYDGTASAVPEAGNILARLITDVGGICPKDRALRVLQLGFGPLVDSFAALRRDNDIHLTVFEPDQRRYERAEFSLSNGGEFTLLGSAETDKLGTYDLIVSASGLHRLPSDLSLGELKRLLAPRALLIAIEPRQTLSKDIVFGLDPNWFGSGLIDNPVGPLRSAEQWRLDIERAGFAESDVRFIKCGADFASLVVAQADAAPAPATDADRSADAKRLLVVASSAQSAIAAKLASSTRLTGLIPAVVSELSDFPAS